jgi:hypothetical protein
LRALHRRIGVSESGARSARPDVREPVLPVPLAAPVAP